MLGNLLGGFIVILVGVTLAPTVADQIRAARGNSTGIGLGTNITGAASTILGLSTLFYCLAVASTGIGIATVGLRNAGLM